MKNNRALDGFENERDFVKTLNKNKLHPYWNILNLNHNNNNHFFIRVEGKKLSKLTNEKILPKSDVYVGIVDIEEDDLIENDYYLDEKSTKNIKKKISKTGISIKMKNTNYQIDKCSVNKFIKRYDSKELFCGATIYSRNIDDFNKNNLVLKYANTTWKEFATFFNQDFLKDIDEATVFTEKHKKIFSLIQKNSYNKIKSLTLENEENLNSLFKGEIEFEEPYCANWLLINGTLTTEVPKEFYVTKGSSNGGKNPTVVFKPI